MIEQWLRAKGIHLFDNMLIVKLDEVEKLLETAIKTNLNKEREQEAEHKRERDQYWDSYFAEIEKRKARRLRNARVNRKLRMRGIK